MSDNGDNGSEPQDKKKIEPPEAPSNRQSLGDDSSGVELDSEGVDLDSESKDE